jgi:F-type H+-transporting ATPase subunit c
MQGLDIVGLGLGLGLVLVGAAKGIGQLGAAALESSARQPEIAGQLQTMMIIAAGMIEGAALFAIVVLGFIK